MIVCILCSMKNLSNSEFFLSEFWFSEILHSVQDDGWEGSGERKSRSGAWPRYGRIFLRTKRTSEGWIFRDSKLLFSPSVPHLKYCTIEIFNENWKLKISSPSVILRVSEESHPPLSPPLVIICWLLRNRGCMSRRLLCRNDNNLTLMPN